MRYRKKDVGNDWKGIKSEKTNILGGQQLPEISRLAGEKEKKVMGDCREEELKANQKESPLSHGKQTLNDKKDNSLSFHKLDQIWCQKSNRNLLDEWKTKIAKG